MTGSRRVLVLTGSTSAVTTGAAIPVTVTTVSEGDWTRASSATLVTTC